MAKIGLKNFVYSHLTENETGTASYDGVKTPAKAVSCKVSVSTSSAKLYADDALAESDTSFSGGTVTLGIDNDDDKTMADILGHTIDEKGEMVRNANDIAPYVGIGRIVVKLVNGKKAYKVEWISKVKFSEPSQDEKTKGENLEFDTTELEGTISTLKDGTWSRTHTFDTEEAAKTYLNSLAAKVGA